MARNLIILRCGRSSLHWQWLAASPRNWDIILCPYEDIDARNLESHLIVGQKWSGLHQFLTAFPAWREYDYICLPDDDIEADGATWNTFFDRCLSYKVSLAAPALTQDSYFWHPVTLQNTEFLARSTTFVEIMNPCFSRSFLEAALPTFALSRSGTGLGLDFLWGLMLSYRGIWIIDETAVRHTRPVGGAGARSGVIGQLAIYDMRRIIGLGVPFDAHTTGGVDRDGQFSSSTEADFETKLRRGYACVNQFNPNQSQQADFKHSQPAPELNQVAKDRLQLALAHLAVPDRTISRNRPCLISSISEWSWSQDAALDATGANDGLLNGECGFHTDLEVNPWWQIDLEAAYDITSIAIYNRLDMKGRCVDFDILCSLDNRAWITALSKRDGQLFGGLDGSPFRAKFDPAVRGRFVRVQLVGHSYLHLDQVEIFGTAAQTVGALATAKTMPVGENGLERPNAYAVESVMIFERLLSDPRGQFLLKRSIAKVAAKPTTETDLSAFFGFNHMPNDGADLTKVERLAAAIDSSNYLNSAMAGCQRYRTAAELLTAGMQARCVPNGLVLEFGVHLGNSINHLASLDPGRVFGFDSFEGLPEYWRSDIPKDAFKLDKLPDVGNNVELVVGWFEDTLADFVSNNHQKIGFMHIDCDLYSSTRTILHHFFDRIVPGTVIVFDEYFNYVGWRNHEYKAFAEFMAEASLSYRYFGAVPSHQQVGIIIE